VRRLIDLALGPDGEIREDIAAQVLQDLSRSDLKRFLSALRRELKQRRVFVTLAGSPSAGMEEAISGSYGGRALSVERDETMGAGVRVRAGDDIVDASVRGYIRDIIEKLEGT
jgi:F0F1-type ATP synthase delta subunit